MDPPRPRLTRGKKKKRAVKRKSNRADDLYDPHFDEVDVIRSPRPDYTYESDVDSSYDEIQLSDAECPAINDHEEESEDDDTIVKRLYKGPRKCRCCVNWIKTPPQAASEPKSKEKASKYAVTARYTSRKRDNEVTTSIHSIAVHSQHLKDVLSKVLDKYPGINIGRGDASFFPPFQPLVHVWKELETSISELEGEAHEHGKALLEIVEPEIGETLKDRDDLLSRGLITHRLLWTLYKYVCL